MAIQFLWTSLPTRSFWGRRRLAREAREDLRQEFPAAKGRSGTSDIVVETAYDKRVPGYESWWDGPIAEVSEVASVRAARENYVKAREKQGIF